MANTITKQTLLDGSKTLRVKVNIEGTGDGDIDSEVIINASEYDPPYTDCKITNIESFLNGFTAKLEWAADSPVMIMQLPQGDSRYSDHSGLLNNAGAGKTGDILLSTADLEGFPNDKGTIIITIKKKGTF